MLPSKINKGGQHMSKDSKILELQNLPETGLLRVNQILRFIPISRSSWWAGVKSGRFPKPIKLSERVTVWRCSDIRNLVEGIQPYHPSIDKVIRQEVGPC
jgi:predicted DNA-binding transcriptional regulator AlpA